MFKLPSPTALYTLSLHDALPIWGRAHTLILAGGSTSRSSTRGSFIQRRGASTTLSRRGSSQAPHQLKLLLAIMNDPRVDRSEEHTSELQSQFHLVCRLLLEKKNE